MNDLPPIERDAKGRFTNGADALKYADVKRQRLTAKMFRSISMENINEAINQLMTLVRQGDVKAIKLLLDKSTVKPSVNISMENAPVDLTNLLREFKEKLDD